MQKLGLVSSKSLDKFKLLYGPASGTAKASSFSSCPSTDSISLGSFANLKLTAEKLVKEQASDEVLIGKDGRSQLKKESKEKLPQKQIHQDDHTPLNAKSTKGRAKGKGSGENAEVKEEGTSEKHVEPNVSSGLLLLLSEKVQRTKMFGVEPIESVMLFGGQPGLRWGVTKIKKEKRCEGSPSTSGLHNVVLAEVELNAPVLRVLCRG